MSQRSPRNLSVSVANRLLQHARESGEDYQYVLMHYALERLMYRMSLSHYRSQFIIKGAMLFLIWTGEQYRPTKDLDLTSTDTLSIDQIRNIFHDLCNIKVEEDGLIFKSDTVHAEGIREENIYGGIRVTFQAFLGSIRIPVQVDIGFSDSVIPIPREEKFPTLLEFPAPILLVYPRESVIAEKYETIITLAITNSRMKDYYDIWLFSQMFDFDGEILKDAIEATFRRRRTALPTEIPVGLSQEFVSDVIKQNQWKAFIERSKLRMQEKKIGIVVERVRDFVMPPSSAVYASKPFSKVWLKGGPWKPK